MAYETLVDILFEYLVCSETVSFENKVFYMQFLKSQSFYYLVPDWILFLVLSVSYISNNYSHFPSETLKH